MAIFIDLVIIWLIKISLLVTRVLTPPGKSWKVLEFLLENLQDLESPGK